MPLWVDRKYARLVASKFRNFKQSGGNFIFACPICGDSKKDRSKARGNLYARGQRMQFYCYNGCGGMSFNRFLKLQDPNLYGEYISEVFTDNTRPEPLIASPTEINSLDDLIEPARSSINNILTRCDLLSEDSDAIVYLKNRGIDPSHWKKMFFCPDLNIMKDVFVEYEEKKFPVEPRIVIPVLDQRGDLKGIVSRAISSKSQLRYINLKISDTESMVFGLNDYDLNKTVFVVEGAFDKFFLSNSLACNTLDFSSSFPYINKGRDILVYDNSPRNPHVVANMLKSQELGYKVCVWPEHIKSKDINDMIKSQEVKRNEIEDFIKNHSYEGLQLELEIQQWKKISR